MEAWGSGDMYGQQGHTVAEPPLNTVLNCWGEELQAESWGPVGRADSLPRVLSFWATLGSRSQSVSRHQAEGIFQMDQLLSRNRVSGREECSTRDWKVQACSSILPPGPFRPQEELLEGLTWAGRLLDQEAL